MYPLYRNWMVRFSYDDQSFTIRVACSREALIDVFNADALMQRLKSQTVMHEVTVHSVEEVR